MSYYHHSEENAVFNFGFRLSVDHQRQRALRLLNQHSEALLPEIHQILLSDNVTISQCRAVMIQLKKQLNHSPPVAVALCDTVDALVDKSVWIIGGNCWVSDIGYGGLDLSLAIKLSASVMARNARRDRAFLLINTYLRSSR
ncbi:hypothetical protein [Candidatus Pantoea bituminis]|uniref:hypothetical protein n=1 Tax=Candidatus Pantoea bituminis TaxID=2831036 RepID=UPI001C060339|nr:hypothetical protein [Pantoea bituminis]